MPEPSPRDPSFRGSNWDTRPIGFAPQTHQVNDHRNSSRRGNFGSHSRGDGPYHNNYGSKRDHQDRGNFMNPRDVQMHQQQRPPPRGLVRPLPPSSATFSPQSARPFANPMGFPGEYTLWRFFLFFGYMEVKLISLSFLEFVYIPTLPLEPIRGMPFVSHAPHPTMFIPVAESSMPPLPSLIVNQIDYYFRYIYVFAALIYCQLDTVILCLTNYLENCSLQWYQFDKRWIFEVKHGCWRMGSHIFNSKLSSSMLIIFDLVQFALCLTI